MAGKSTEVSVESIRHLFNRHDVLCHSFFRYHSLSCASGAHRELVAMDDLRTDEVTVAIDSYDLSDTVCCHRLVSSLFQLEGHRLISAQKNGGRNEQEARTCTLLH